MSGETEQHVSGWTVDTSREDLLRVIADQQKYFERRLLDQQNAVKIANEASEKRFESVNEFRGQLNDQVRTFLPRAEYDARHETLENRVSELTNRLNRSEGKSTGLNAGWTIFLGGLGAVSLVVGIILAFSR